MLLRYIRNVIQGGGLLFPRPTRDRESREMVRSTLSKDILIRRALLALLALAFLGVLLVLPSGSADAATIFTVNKTGDAGDRKINGVCDASRKRGKQCTLRAAIQEANDPTVNPGLDTINFNIGGTAGVKTISPASPLPGISDSVTIDGYTQRGASENTLAVGNDAVLKLQLNGTNAGTIANPDPDGLGILASNSTIKGLVINRFGGDGVEILGDGATGNKVEGNFLGTTANGTDDRGNERGVLIRVNADSNTIGGTQPAQRNLLSGNVVSGVAIFGSENNKVEGNYIGTQKNGLTALENGDQGVFIGSASNNTIGDSDPSDGLTTAANTIAFNRHDGIVVSQTTSTGNRILSNKIFQNGAVGIDLQGTNDVTDNDTDDPDTGANNLQNFPVISTATRNSTTGITTITGTLNSNPSQSYTIQCFLTEAGGDSSGNGEGETLLDTTTSTTDANGDSPNPGFTCTSNNSDVLANVSKVSATATNTVTGDTSEFSANVTVTSST